MRKLDRAIQLLRIKKAVQFIPDGASVLDIGCMEGELFKYLGDRIGSGIGVDPRLPSPVRTPRYTLIRGRWPEDVPPTMAFDVVTLLAVIEHLPEDILAIFSSRCAQMMKPGGRLILTVPSPFVDVLLRVLKTLRLMDAIAFEEHHGFVPANIFEFIGSPYFRLYHHERFEFGFNHIFVFARI